MNDSVRRTARPVTVLVADGQPLVAEALGVALNCSEKLDVILGDHPRDGPDVVAAAERHRPDVAVLDHQLRLMRGPALVASVLTQAPRTKVIMLSALHSVEQIHEILGAGAIGFLPKVASLSQVEQAILRAHAGESVVFDNELERHIERLQGWSDMTASKTKQLRSLTARELQVLRHLAGGLSAVDIGKELGVSSATVRTHIKRILAKTNTQSQVEALSYAREAGFIG